MGSSIFWWAPGPLPRAYVSWGNPGSGHGDPAGDPPPAFPGGRRADTPRGRQGSGPPELEGVPTQHSHPPHSAPLCCAQAALPDGPGCSLAAAPAPSWCPHRRQPRGHLEAPPSQPGLSQTPTYAWDFSSGRQVSGPLLGGLAARGCIHPARHTLFGLSPSPGLDGAPRGHGGV